MIINFTVKNYRSFRDTTNLTMEADNLQDDSVVLVDALSDRRILPAVGIFGANASGKSNILKGLTYFIWAINNSNQVNGSVSMNPLMQRFVLDNNTDPTEFEIELLSQDHTKEYTYGFALQGNKIIHEWFDIVERVSQNRTQKQVFDRKNTKIVFGSAYKKELSKYEDTLKLDEGLLTLNRLANLVSHQTAQDFLEEINRIVVIGGPMPINFNELHEDAELRKRVANIIKESDACVQDINIEEYNMPVAMRNQIIHNPNVAPNLKSSSKFYLNKTVHNSYIDGEASGTTELDFLNNESNGTHKLLGCAQLMVKALTTGGVLAIDELDASLHPFITAKVVKTFMDKTSNPNGAQLIFTSHEAYLMSRAVSMRTDQIYLTNKDSQERSTLTPLSDYDIRNTTAIDKRYIDERLGGTPNVTDGGYEINGALK